jgi:WD40 repeat protein
MLNVSIDSMTMCVGIIPNPHELSFRTNRNRAPMHEITSKYCQRNLTFTSSFILRPSSFHSTSRSRYRYIIYSKSVYPIKKSTMSAFGSPQQQQSSIAPEDCNIPQPGGDGISSLCWSPTANYLVSSNWDGGVRCWEVADQGGRVQAQAKAMSTYPINLCCMQ